MKIRLKTLNEWANGEVLYVKGQEYDMDNRYAQELIDTGKFEKVVAEKPELKKKEIK